MAVAFASPVPGLLAYFVEFAPTRNTALFLSHREVGTEETLRTADLEVLLSELLLEETTEQLHRRPNSISYRRELHTPILSAYPDPH